MIGETRYEIRASLKENGEPTLKVLGRCSYGEGEAARDATHTFEITNEKQLAKVAKALEDVLTEDVLKEMNQQVKKAVARCLTVAAERGEL